VRGWSERLLREKNEWKDEEGKKMKRKTTMKN
jgi:hypothetical protein